MKKSDDTNSSEIESAQEPNLMARLRREYGEADAFARKVSDYRGDAVIPAHNELRYAGFHLLGALADDRSLQSEEQMREAISHCRRAKYEAAEAGIMWALNSIKIFQDDYRTTPISDVLPDYIDSCEKVENARKKLGAARDSGGGKPEELMKTFDEVSEIQKRFEIARSELNKKNEQLRKTYFHRIIAVAVMILAAAIGFLADIF